MGGNRMAAVTIPIRLRTRSHKIRTDKGVMGIDGNTVFVSLEIDGEQYRFQSIKEFRDFLSGRTRLPEERIQTLHQYNIKRLKKEIDAVNKTIKQINSALFLYTDNSVSIHGGLKMIEQTLFTRDHYWRAIVKSLSLDDPVYNEFRCAALEVYLQYLQARLETAESLLSKLQRQ